MRTAKTRRSETRGRLAWGEGSSMHEEGRRGGATSSKPSSRHLFVCFGDTQTTHKEGGGKKDWEGKEEEGKTENGSGLKAVEKETNLGKKIREANLYVKPVVGDMARRGGKKDQKSEKAGGRGKRNRQSRHGQTASLGSLKPRGGKAAGQKQGPKEVGKHEGQRPSDRSRHGKVPSHATSRKGLQQHRARGIKAIGEGEGGTRSGKEI